MMIYFLLFSPPQHLCPLNYDSNINLINTNASTNILVSWKHSHSYWTWETMRRRPRTTFLLSFLAILLLFATFSLNLSRNALSRFRFHSDIHTRHTNNLHPHTKLVNEFSHQKRRVSSINFKDSISTVSILLPDWEILLIVSPNTALHSDDRYRCLFRNNAFSPAKFSGVLPFTNRTTFKCDMPESVRRRRIFSQPVLVTGTSENEPEDPSTAPELMRWNFLVYESFSMDHDVVLFAKGVNHRQGYDRSPKELRCVFRSGDNAVRTAVTSSVQEVFRCPHPDPSEFGLGSDYQSFQESEKIGISLEIIGENLVVPSVAYYMPRPNSVAQAQAHPKYSLCACTMVYNVGKFLREWVMYHSKVGVENFILYDNGSDDDLEGVVKELRGEGYNISTLLWIWPKTQEAGFSHSVVHSKSLGLCSWIMYVDVDEFVFSPLWRNGNGNESHSLKSILPKGRGINNNKSRIGQVSIGCYEFGPSGQRKHPVEGVTQGYTCRRKVEQRHKSILLVDAVDPSLRNVIHHFHVNEKEGFRSKQIGMEKGVVNHYKYQAWDEFKSKFRRRVSAYVVDWRQAVNPKSKDRTPGLGFQPIEPKDWIHKFCEVRDQRLQSFTKAWFGSNANSTMAWQTS